MLVDHLLKTIQESKETEVSKYIYRNQLGKACFQHDMTYGDFKHLAKRTASDKIFYMKQLTLLRIQNMMNIKVVLLLIKFQLLFYIILLQTVLSKTKLNKTNN